jgi:RNA polymerase sigma factor FliA
METGYEAITSERREQLILEHLPQVRWIAACIHERLAAGTLLEDLMSAGIIGLIGAVDHFDPSRNTTLRTYAEYRIRGAILDSIKGLDGIPVHKRNRLKIVQDAISAAEQKYQRAPSGEEVARELSLLLREYQTWLEELRGVTLGSLDSVAHEDCDGGLLRYIADNSSESVSQLIEREQMHRLLVEGIEAMPAVEQTILDLYFHRELTLAEIGQVLDLHVSRICQLKVQAIARLRAWIARRLSPRAKRSHTNG